MTPGIWITIIVCGTVLAVTILDLLQGGGKK